MYVSEVFHSIQGEGSLAGTPSVFVRTSGCNLRCWFCDTAYTSWEPEGVHRDWRDVLDEVCAVDCEHVVVTGGEPLLAPEVVDLTHALAERGRHVTIETAGTVFRPVHADLLSLSPKLANSVPDDAVWGPRHERTRDAPQVVRRMLEEYAYQLKFVVDAPGDVAGVLQWLEWYPEARRDRVWLMPQSTTAGMIHERMAWLPALAAEHGFRVSPRKHVEWWGNVRGR